MADMPPIEASARDVKAWREIRLIHTKDAPRPGQLVGRCGQCDGMWPCHQWAYATTRLIACGAGIEEET